MKDVIIRRVEIPICQKCLDGAGGECHTPGCAFFLHQMDTLPIIREMYIIRAIEEDDLK